MTIALLILILLAVIFPGLVRGVFVLMGLAILALIGMLAMAACSLQTPDPEMHSNVLGLTEKQISSCLGAPVQKSTEGNAEVWSYPDGQSCSVRISFLYGRASHVGYVGANGQPLTTGACPLVGEHCALR